MPSGGRPYLVLGRLFCPRPVGPTFLRNAYWIFKETFIITVHLVQNRKICPPILYPEDILVTSVTSLKLGLAMRSPECGLFLPHCLSRAICWSGPQRLFSVLARCFRLSFRTSHFSSTAFVLTCLVTRLPSQHRACSVLSVAPCNRPFGPRRSVCIAKRPLPLLGSVAGSCL